ncbi:secretagogin-like, partial [Sphaeramia orbicularis]|uniref:secretagogin-like n=1 Tax=Sphaeramia orbicularis TaxID=375764 RepID=UPI00117D0EB8
MDAALQRLDAAGFLQIWKRLDPDDHGYIEGKQLEELFRHAMEKLGMKDDVSAEEIQRLKEKLNQNQNQNRTDPSEHKRLHIQE